MREVTIKKINQELNMPKYATDGSVGVDLIVREDTLVPCNKFIHNIKDIFQEMLKVIAYQESNKIETMIGELPDSFNFKRTMIPLNIQVQYPENKWGLLVPRGSLYKEKGIVQSNSVGIIDTDFCSEHWFPAINLSNKDVLIKKGEAICQLIFLTFEQVKLIEGEVRQHEKHNGNGSTNGYKK